MRPAPPSVAARTHAAPRSCRRHHGSQADRLVPDSTFAKPTAYVDDASPHTAISPRQGAFAKPAHSRRFSAARFRETGRVSTVLGGALSRNLHTRGGSRRGAFAKPVESQRFSAARFRETCILAAEQQVLAKLPNRARAAGCFREAHLCPSIAAGPACLARQPGVFRETAAEARRETTNDDGGASGQVFRETAAEVKGGRESCCCEAANWGHATGRSRRDAVGHPCQRSNQSAVFSRNTVELGVRVVGLTGRVWVGGGLRAGVQRWGGLRAGLRSAGRGPILVQV